MAGIHVMKAWRRRGVTQEEAEQTARATRDAARLELQARQVSARLREHVHRNHFAERIGDALRGSP